MKSTVFLIILSDAPVPHRYYTGTVPFQGVLSIEKLKLLRQYDLICRNSILFKKDSLGMTLNDLRLILQMSKCSWQNVRYLDRFSHRSSLKMSKRNQKYTFLFTNLVNRVCLRDQICKYKLKVRFHQIWILSYLL